MDVFTIPARATSTHVLDGYITEEELARQWGVSVRTCQRSRALRRGPPYLVLGRQVYYRVEAVLRWLAEHEVDTENAQRRRGRP